MKVVHVFNEIKYSGAEIMYFDAIDIFKNLGVELIIVASAKEIGNFAPQFSEKGRTVFHKPYPKWYNYVERIRYYKLFVQFLKTQQIDIVHSHSSKTFWDMALCARIAGKKCIHTFHNVFKPHWYSYFYHFSLRIMAKYLFCCKFQSISDSVYDNELKRYNNQTQKIFNWINSNRFYAATPNEKCSVRNELGIAQNAYVLISIGECSTIKRHSDIIQALPEIKKVISNIVYIQLGSGELLEQEKELARKLGVINDIQFYSNELNVRKFLIAADVYVMTSKFEGISLTTIEAMACKVPAILYDVPGLHDFNKHSTTSFLIPEKPSAIVQQVVAIYNSQSDTNAVAVKLIDDAYKNVIQNYSMNKNVTNIFELYL